MKKLLVKSLILISLLFTSLVLFVYFAPVERGNYLAADIDKRARLEKTSGDDGRLIFIGGSNLAFGLDSELIEKEFDEPVINMGLHAGLGLKFMVNEVKPNIRAKDKVIIIPEYKHFYGDWFLGGSTILLLCKFDHSALKFVTFQQWLHLAQGTALTFIRKLFKSSIKSIYYSLTGVNGQNNNGQNNIYYRKAFNQYGDVISHLGIDKSPDKNKDLYSDNKDAFNYSVVHFLNKFKEFVEKRNASVYFMYPPLPRYIYEKNESLIRDFQVKLRESLNIRILGKPTDFIFKNDYFFDTIYHLDTKGRNIRTKKVLDNLSAVIEN